MPDNIYTAKPCVFCIQVAEVIQGGSGAGFLEDETNLALVPDKEYDVGNDTRNRCGKSSNAFSLFRTDRKRTDSSDPRMFISDVLLNRSRLAGNGEKRPLQAEISFSRSHSWRDFQ